MGANLFGSVKFAKHGVSRPSFELAQGARLAKANRFQVFVERTKFPTVHEALIGRGRVLRAQVPTVSARYCPSFGANDFPHEHLAHVANQNIDLRNE